MSKLKLYYLILILYFFFCALGTQAQVFVGYGVDLYDTYWYDNKTFSPKLGKIVYLLSSTGKLKDGIIYQKKKFSKKKYFAEFTSEHTSDLFFPDSIIVIKSKDGTEFYPLCVQLPSKIKNYNFKKLEDLTEIKNKNFFKIYNISEKEISYITGYSYTFYLEKGEPYIVEEIFVKFLGDNQDNFILLKRGDKIWYITKTY